MYLLTTVWFRFEAADPKGNASRHSIQAETLLNKAGQSSRITSKTKELPRTCSSITVRLSSWRASERVSGVLEKRLEKWSLLNPVVDTGTPGVEIMRIPSTKMRIPMSFENDSENQRRLFWDIIICAKFEGTLFCNPVQVFAGQNQRNSKHNAATPVVNEYLLH